MSKLNEVDDGTFDKEVLQAAEPMLVFFWATWCDPCLIMEPEVELVAQTFAGRAGVVKLNVDDASITTQQYFINNLPRLLLFKGGKEVDVLGGTPDRATIGQMIEKHLK
ncbi:MAG TPA: thioredoxin domain-containing protein [Pyrinomonadaceae bacterium]|nr:thioredoxin domain-containing protein [Pyrinomonadaceae bacterium]